MRNATVIQGLLLGSVLLLGTSVAAAQDWPQWRGPNRDARATGFKAPKTWPKELTQKWKVAVGDGVATPALVGDKLYVFTRQGNDEILRCLDATNGKEIWQNKYEAVAVTRPASQFPGPRSSPAVADGKVVTLGVGGVLSCLDATSGKVIWRKDTKVWPRFFTASSPIIVDDLCIAQVGTESSGGIIAYDLSTANERWKWTNAGPAYASPVLLTLGGDKVIVAETDKSIVAVRVADGKELWDTPYAVSGRGRGYNACTPMVNGQIIMYSGSNRGTKAVKLEKQGDKLESKELWNNPEESVQFNTPVLKDGLLCGLSQSNQLFCLNAQTGKTAWTAQLGQAGGGGGRPGGGGGGRPGRGGMMGRGGYGSIVDAGSVLLALTPSAQLVVFAPSDKKFEQLASYKVAADGTYAYPVVSGNRIFIKDRDSVILWTVD
jgi:outer membrane protein assembly factor BamB